MVETEYFTQLLKMMAEIGSLPERIPDPNQDYRGGIKAKISVDRRTAEAECPFEFCKSTNVLSLPIITRSNAEMGSYGLKTTCEHFAGFKYERSQFNFEVFRFGAEMRFHHEWKEGESGYVKPSESPEGHETP